MVAIDNEYNDSGKIVPILHTDLPQKFFDLFSFVSSKDIDDPLSFIFGFPFTQFHVGTNV